MILEYELVKREGNQVGKRLVYRIVPNDINNSESIPYPNEVEKLFRDGYAIEHVRVLEGSQRLKLYFAIFAVLKDHEYHASAGYIFAYDRDRATELLKKRYGEETRVRSIEELPYEEGTVLFSVDAQEKAPVCPFETCGECNMAYSDSCYTCEFSKESFQKMLDGIYKKTDPRTKARVFCICCGAGKRSPLRKWRNVYICSDCWKIKEQIGDERFEKALMGEES